MKPRKLRNRLAVASSLGVAALAVALLGTAGAASASVTVPPFPAAAVSGVTAQPAAGTQQFGTYPNWLPANDSVSNVDHSEGSDTTLFMMQSLSDLYSQAGLIPFACNLVKTNTSSCETPAQNSGTNPNSAQADLYDNFASTEQLQGINFVGSGNGQAELCGGTPNAPTGTTVDYSRSSKPFQSTCAGVAVGYAKDSVIPVDFPTVDPELYGTATGYIGNNYISYNQVTGAQVSTPFPSGGIGPVAAGWLPGDSFTCNQTSTCSGTPFNNVSNTADPQAGSGASGNTSVAYRLFCQHGSAGATSPYESQIMDWGNLTNLSAAANGGTAQPVGDGAPIGVPIRIIGVNTGSGTVSEFYTFAQSGISSGANCTGTTLPIGASNNLDANAAQGPNPNSPQGTLGNNEIALENDANQIGDFAAANWAAPTGNPTFADAADQAVDIATSLYFEGLGTYSTNTNSQVASIEIPSGATSGLVPTGLPSTFVAAQMKANNVKASLINELANNYVMARTLYNIYRTDKVRASVGGFLNWVCDQNSTFPKGTNHVDGGNFDTDITNIIGGQYGFQRLSDTTAELSATKLQPAGIAVANPNGTCSANMTIASTNSVGDTTITLTSAVPGSVQVGWPVSIPAGYNVAIPAGTTITNISGAVITLSNALVAGTGSGSPSGTQLYFPGKAPVLAVADLNS